MVPAACKESRSDFVSEPSCAEEAQVVSYNGIILPRSRELLSCSCSVLVSEENCRSSVVRSQV